MFTVALVVASAADPLPPGAVRRLGDTRFRAPGEVRHLQFSADRAVLSGWVATPRGGLTPVAWDANTGVPVAAVPDRSPPEAVDRSTPALRVGTNRVLTAGPGNAGRVWDATTARQLARLTGHATGVTAVAASSDGERFATGDACGLVRVWDAVAFRPLLVPRGHTAPVRTLRLSTDGTRLVTTGDDGSARVWDLSSGRELRAFPTAGAVELTRDGLGVVLPNANGVTVRDVLTGLEVVPDRQPARPALTVSELLARCGLCVAVSPDGRTVAVVNAEGGISLLEAVTGGLRRELVGHGVACHAVAFTPDGSRLLTAGADHSVLVWAVKVQDAPLPDPVKRETKAVRLWDTLTTGRAEAAYLAMARFAAEPPAAVAMVRLRLKPATTSEGETRSSRLADARAVELLESLGTPEAWELLEELATGEGTAFRTQEARRALSRLR